MHVVDVDNLTFFCAYLNISYCLFWQIWNQEEAEDGKEEGERGEEEEAGGRTRKKETISGSRHTSGEFRGDSNSVQHVLCDRNCVCNCSLRTALQVMSHNKERRSKRDEKLDKKSQAMEELKAEREKKKNKTGWCDSWTLSDWFVVLSPAADASSLGFTAELLAKRQPLKTSEVYSDDEEEEEEDDDKSSVKSDRSSRSSSYDDDE